MEYRRATIAELSVLWDRNIADHPGDKRWVDWRKAFIDDNESGKAATFLVVSDGCAVGEGTLLLSSECTAVAGRTMLCNDKDTANINALRIRKEYEGQGHISKLMKEIEQYALCNTITKLTIGVEARETRTLAIYLHLGFSEFLFSEVEENTLVLYFGKTLGS